MNYIFALSVLVAVVCVAQCQVAVPKPLPVCIRRNGFCPSLIMAYIKVIPCRDDCQCPYNQKCCRDRCGSVCRPYCPLPYCRYQTKPLSPVNPCLYSRCNIVGAFCRPFHCNGQSQALWYTINPNTGACQRVRCPYPYPIAVGTPQEA